MNRRRKAFVHVGLPGGLGDLLPHALARHDHALVELGVRCPAASRAETLRAAVEIMRTHRELGYERREVEGAWTEICRRGRRGRDTLVVSEPSLAAATTDQIELLFDGLAGFERHIVVTAQAPDARTRIGDPARDLVHVLDRWRRAARRADRVHVVVAGPDEDPQQLWSRFGRVVGFGTASLSVADLPSPHLRAPAAPERVDVLRRIGTGWVEHLRSHEYDVVGDPAHLVPSVGLPGVLVGGA